MIEEGGKVNRIVSLALIASVLLAGLIHPAAAQTTYPEKPIRLVVGFPPGSNPDTVARLLGQKLAEALGQPIVVENIAGAAGSIGADRVAKAVPDGYTLGLLSQPQLAVNPSLYKLPYDPIKDFAPVSQIATSPFLLVVHNALPAKTVKAFVSVAKAQPGGFTFASAGTGSTPHLAAELFKSVAGLDMRHVPYKGVGPATPDLLGGRVTMIFFPISVGLPLVREGKLHALGVTSLRRSSAIPELPTIAESGYPGFEVQSWNGLLTPIATPAPIVRKLYLETIKALAHPDLRAKLAELGLETIGNSPDEFAALIKSEIPKWAKVIKEAGIKPD
jgi:tripartite-type tricarboxylate transporter receptor subunit TctC